MVSRRQVIAGTLTAGAASFGARRVSAAPLPTDNDPDQDSAKLDEILEEVRALRPGPVPGASDVYLIRQALRTYLKSAGKFPEYLDVGIDVWEGLIDFYVATAQPVDIGRLPDGRYFLKYLVTNIVLRSEVPEGHVGVRSDTPSRL
jgi:hypothetical protein